MALAQILGRRDFIANNLGEPAKGALVNVYEPNSTNRVTSYKASDLVVANDNPVKLSGSGRGDIWVTRNVDIRITDKDGNLIVEELSVNPDDLGGVFDSGLIPNGSFETDADVDDVPDGWTEEVTSAGSNNGIEATESTDGGKSLRTQSAGSGGGEFRTTAFFPVNDADDLRVNFDLRSTVATVRNIVRVEWYDISQVSISNTDVYDSTANPATFTSQVKTATPPANARFAKLRIMGGITGGILAGITYWDRFQVFYPQVVSGVFDNITISGNAIITTNTNGDLSITPNGTGDTVVKNLEALTTAQLGFAGEVTLDIGAANDVRIRTDINTATPPVAEAVTASLSLFDAEGVDLLADFGFVGSNHLRIRNHMHGGNIRIQGEDAAGVTRNVLDGSPGGQLALYHPGSDIIRMLMESGGSVSIRSDTNTDIENRALVFEHKDGTDRGAIGFTSGNNVMSLRSYVHGGQLLLIGEETGAATRTMIACDPDGAISIHHPGANVIRMQTLTGGVVELRSDTSTDVENRYLLLAHQDGSDRGAVGYFGNGLLGLRNLVHGEGIRLDAEQTGGAQRALLVGDPDTTVDIYNPASNEIVAQSADPSAADSAGGFNVKGPDDVFRAAGFNTLPRQAISGGNVTLGQGHQGKVFYYDEATARSLLLNNDPNIPVDAYFAYNVGPTGGTLTGNGGAGVTITYWNGSGWTTTAAAGNITIGVGQGTIWKQSDTNYVVVGPTLS